MFCWCYYAHITRIARSSPLGPVGSEPERETERVGESGKEKGSKGGERRQGNLPKKQLPGKMTETPGLFRQGKGGEEGELGMEMEGNWNNQVLMCWGWQTFLPLLH